MKLVLDVDETDETFDLGQSIYASVPGERSDLFFWQILATPAGVSVQRSVAAPMVMDSWQHRMVPGGVFSDLRAALGHVAAELQV